MDGLVMLCKTHQEPQHRGYIMNTENFNQADKE